MAVLLITHDLGVVAETCDEVIVMYAGQVVERASADALFAHPRHPYTAGLLRAVPRMDDSSQSTGRNSRLAEIPGMVPALGRFPIGCRFQDRCDRAQEKCRIDPPLLVERVPGHLERCHFPIDTAPTDPPRHDSGEPS